MSSGLPEPRVWIALGGSSESPGRPLPLTVQCHLVLVEPARLETLDADERVMVAGDAEGWLGAAEHLDLAGLARLHPDRRLGFRDIAQQRTDQDFRHGPSLPGRLVP